MSLSYFIVCLKLSTQKDIAPVLLAAPVQHGAASSTPKI
jgi:hypothetical protein